MTTNSILSGVSWAGLGQFGSQGIRLLFLLVLAALLGPDSFGLISLAMIYILIAQSVSEMGIVSAIVHTGELDDRYLNTAFLLGLVPGLLFAGLSYLLSRPISAVLGDPHVIPLIRTLALLFPLFSIVVVPRGLLERSFRFDSLAGRDLLGELAYGLTGIPMAVLGFGVWSLVLATIMRAVASTVYLWFAVDWMPGWTISRQSAGTLLDFSLPAMGSDFIVRVFENTDYYLVGLFLGTEALGIYTLAYQLAVTPGRRVIGIFRRVTFASFSRIRGTMETLREEYLESLKLVYYALFPVALLTAFAGPQAIINVYDQHWWSTAEIIPALILVPLLLGFDIDGALFLALGRPGLRGWLMGGRVLLFVVFAAILSVRFGLLGVAIGLALGVSAMSIAGVVLVSRYAKVGMWAILKSLMQPLTLTGVVFVPVGLLYYGVYWPSTMPLPLVGILGLVIGVAYLIGVYIIQPSFRSGVDVLAERFSMRFGGMFEG